MFQMDCLTVQEHHDDTCDERTSPSVYMSTAANDPIDNVHKRRSTIELYSQLSLFEELAHIKRILEVFKTDKNEAGVA
jgi:hypothetical protein